MLSVIRSLLGAGRSGRGVPQHAPPERFHWRVAELESRCMLDGVGFGDGEQFTSPEPLLASPTISTIDDQVIDEDTSLTIPFDIGNLAPDPNSVQVTATSGNQDLIPNENIVVFLADGASSGTIGITPGADQFGVSLITIAITASVS